MCRGRRGILLSVSYTHLDVYKRQVLRFGDVELLPVLIVEVSDVLIGDRDLRDDLAIDELLDRKLIADALLEVVYGCLLYTSRCV